MALSGRERNIAVGTIAVAAVGLLYYFVINPYLAAGSQLDTDLANARSQQTAQNELASRFRDKQKVWKDIQNSGLKSDVSVAETQAEHALLYWTQHSGVQLIERHQTNATPEGAFQVINFSLTISGPMRAISDFIWQVEGTSLPMQLNDAQFSTAKEGTDDITAHLNISTLCMPPAAPAKPSNASTAAPAPAGT